MRPARPSTGGHATSPASAIGTREAGLRGFAVVVELHGEQDIANAPEILETLRATRGNVLIDLSACSFLDSSLISSLLTGSRELEQARRYLEVVAPHENTAITRTVEFVRRRDRIVVHNEWPASTSTTEEG